MRYDEGFQITYNLNRYKFVYTDNKAIIKEIFYSNNIRVHTFVIRMLFRMIKWTITTHRTVSLNSIKCTSL